MKRIILAILIIGIGCIILISNNPNNVSSSISSDKLKIQNIQTVLVDDFDIPGSWVVKYSKYRSRNYSTTKTNYKESNTKDWISFISTTGSRQSLLADGLPKNVKLKQKYILGVRSKFDFKGYNYFYIEPVTKLKDALGRMSKGDPSVSLKPEAKPDEILKELAITMTPQQKYEMSQFGKKIPQYIKMVGKAKALDVWVWGKNYNYSLEVHIMDYMGNVYIIPAGSLKFKGWKNVRINIPQFISQTQQHIPQVQPIKFLRFKISTKPDERIDNFSVFFDYMQILTDTYEESFVGDELVDPKGKIWNNADKSGSSSDATTKPEGQ